MEYLPNLKRYIIIGFVIFFILGPILLMVTGNIFGGTSYGDIFVRVLMFGLSNSGESPVGIIFLIFWVIILGILIGIVISFIQGLIQNKKYVYLFSLIIIILVILILIIFFLISFSIKKSNDSVLKQSAMDNGDPSICDDIIDHTDKDLCFQYATSKINNSEICKNINSEKGKNVCYANIAVENRDIKGCDLVKSIYGYSREECYLDIANLLNDPEICELITNTYTKESCLNYASK